MRPVVALLLLNMHTIYGFCFTCMHLNIYEIGLRSLIVYVQGLVQAGEFSWVHTLQNGPDLAFRYDKVQGTDDQEARQKVDDFDTTMDC